MAGSFGFWGLTYPAYVHKPAGEVFMFFRATGGAAIYENGLIVTATREQLAA